MSYLDEFGKVLAMKDTEVKDPWVVLESSRFPGRFYFFDMEAKKTAWSLEPFWIKSYVAPVAESAPLSPPRKINRSNSRNLLAELVPISEKGAQNACRSMPSPTCPSLPSVNPNSGGQQSHRAERRRLLVASEPKRDSFESVESIMGAASMGRPPLQVVDGLGQGGFGVVVQVEHTVSKCPYAMKVISKAKLARRRDRQRLALELKIMDTMGPSPFCQQFYQSFETKTCVFIVMDLQRGGDLFFHLMERIANTGAAFSEKELRVLMAELTLALEHMHEQGFIHRDVKVENVMLDSKGHVKLIDFGLACELTNDVMPLSPTGSIIYMAPELIHKSTGGRHTDWWAVGVLAFELLTGESPWTSIDDKRLLKEEIGTKEIISPIGISSSTDQFIGMLTRVDYRDRLGTTLDAEVRDAPFFVSVDWEKTAALQNEPAFKPPATCVCAEESIDAAREYRRLSRVEDEADEPKFTMGLRVSGSFPQS